MKRAIIAVMLVAATLTLIYAGASNVKKLDTNNLALDKAIEHALASNSQILLNEGKVKTAKVNLDEAKSARGRAIRQEATKGEFETEKAVKGYYVFQAQIGLTAAENTLIQSREQLKAKVQVDYFTIKNAISKLEKANLSYDLAGKAYDIVKAKLEVGLASELELMQSETALEKSKAGRMSAVRAVGAAERALSKTLSLPLDTKITLADDIVMLDLPSATAVEKLEEAVKDRMECITAREQAKLDKMEFEIILPWYDPITYKYKHAENNLQSSNITVLETEEQVKMTVYKAYDDMMNAYEALPAAQMMESQAEKAYEVAIIKYQSGMITADKVTDALASLADAQINYAQAVLTYNLSVITFENSYGIGI